MLQIASLRLTIFALASANATKSAFKFGLSFIFSERSQRRCISECPLADHQLSGLAPLAANAPGELQELGSTVSLSASSNGTGWLPCQCSITYLCTPAAMDIFRVGLSEIKGIDSCVQSARIHARSKSASGYTAYSRMITGTFGVPRCFHTASHVQSLSTLQDEEHRRQILPSSYELPASKA